MPSYGLCQQLHSGAHTPPTPMHIHIYTYFKINKSIKNNLYNIEFCFVIFNSVIFGYLLEFCSFLITHRKGSGLQGRKSGKEIGRIVEREIIIRTYSMKIESILNKRKNLKSELSRAQFNSTDLPYQHCNLYLFGKTNVFDLCCICTLGYLAFFGMQPPSRAHTLEQNDFPPPTSY